MENSEETYNQIEKTLGPLLDFVSQQEDFTQQVCILFCVTNLARIVNVTEGLGILERAKFILTEKPEEDGVPTKEPFSFIC